MTEQYTPQEMKLAHEIASTLNDHDSLALHLQHVRKYKEEYLQKTLAKVMAIPEHKIKRNRAALYTYLISQADKSHGTGH